METEHAPTSARAIATAEVRRRIVAESRRQLGVVGPAQLSLRAVARDLGMASSAIYRHFASRDELVTTLIVAAYEELAQETGAAVDPAADPHARWRAWCHAVRSWALSHPHDYALIYGSPIPGYAAPARTTASALQVLAPIIALFGDVTEHDGLAEDPALADSLAPMTTVAADLAPGAGDDLEKPTPGAIARGIGAWSTIMGYLSLELFGHLTGGVADSGTLWTRIVEQTVRDLGVHESGAAGGEPDPRDGATGAPTDAPDAEADSPR